jgi:hypothetical protein
MSSLRTILESRDGGRWKLLTSDLEAFRSELGEDVLEDFCRCYVVADRMTSLVSIFHLATKDVAGDSIGARRNNLTFFYLVSEAVKTLQLCLEGLRASLNKAGIWDEASWMKNLGKIEEWGNDPANSAIRNRVAAHVDRDNVRRGLDLIQADTPRAILSEGDGGKLRESWAKLANDAVIAGLELSKDQFTKAVLGVEHLDADTHLDGEFWRVLESKGLLPIQSRVHGERS